MIAGFTMGAGAFSVAYGDDAYEPNNTLKTAWYRGTDWEQKWLSSIDGWAIQADDDWYRIDVDSGSERVQVDVRFTEADGDIDVCLVDGLGGYIACSTSTTDNEFIETEVPAPDTSYTYYIYVFGANAVNIYNLWWDDIPQDDAYEENDMWGTAWHPGDNWESTWLSSIDGWGVQLDDDWYRIDVDSGFERVQVDVQFTHADGDIDVCLFDGFFGAVIACSTSTTDNEIIDTEVPNPGRYTIQVYYGNAGNIYDLWWDDTPNTSLLNLVIWYYQNILDRDPESGGTEGWTAEIERIVSLGIDVKEGFIALGKLFFNSEEYLAKGKTDEAYIVDLYETFLHRTPSGIGVEVGEVDDWEAELAGGLTRNLLLNYFIFSDEFRTYMEGIFGTSSACPEYSLVNDLYRGFLARLPDDVGFNSWLALMREAMNTGEQAVRDLTNAIGLFFLHSEEYALRGSDNSEYITDLYDAILRRGAELAGYLSWLADLDAGMTREQALQYFVNSNEYQGRVQELIDAGWCQITLP
jgi:hypothetical protein